MSMTYAARITALPLPEPGLKWTINAVMEARGLVLAAATIAARADDEISALRARVGELERAGQAVVDRWETPLWKDARHTADFIHDLRDAINKESA